MLDYVMLADLNLILKEHEKSYTTFFTIKLKLFCFYIILPEEADFFLLWSLDGLRCANGASKSICIVLLKIE